MYNNVNIIRLNSRCRNLFIFDQDVIMLYFPYFRFLEGHEWASSVGEVVADICIQAGTCYDLTWHYMPECFSCSVKVYHCVVIIMRKNAGRLRFFNGLNCSGLLFQ